VGNWTISDEFNTPIGGGVMAFSGIFTYNDPSSSMNAWASWKMGAIQPAPAKNIRLNATANLTPSQQIFVYLGTDGTITLNSKETLSFSQGTTWVAINGIYQS
jgi:hypothetical protein